MDWVRGRPPDALLFLKALLKTAPSGLSVLPPASARNGIEPPRTDKLGSRPHPRTAAAATIPALEEGGDGEGDVVDDGDILSRTEGARTFDAPNGPGTTTLLRNSGGSSTAAADGRAPRSAVGLSIPGGPVPCPPDTEGGGCASSSPSAMDKMGVTVSRTLAEGALLGPLRDVGTVAGGLRSGLGSSLREMAAAR